MTITRELSLGVASKRIFVVFRSKPFHMIDWSKFKTDGKAMPQLKITSDLTDNTFNKLLRILSTFASNIMSSKQIVP